MCVREEGGMTRDHHIEVERINEERIEADPRETMAEQTEREQRGRGTEHAEAKSA